MQRLITVEEHFISDRISKKCTEIIMQHGTEDQRKARQNIVCIDTFRSL